MTDVYLMDHVKVMRRLGRPAWLLNYRDVGHQMGGDAECLDVLIMPKELYEHEKDSGMYADLRETFGDEVFESLGAVDDQHLELDGSSSVAEEFGLRYDPVCICLPGNVKNKENALKWIQSVLK